MDFGVWRLGFRVQGSGFRQVQKGLRGLGFRGQGLGLSAEFPGLKVSGLGRGPCESLIFSGSGFTSEVSRI